MTSLFYIEEIIIDLLKAEWFQYIASEPAT